MQKVKYAKVPLWRIVKKILSPRLKAPGMPIDSPDGDPFLISEKDDVIYEPIGGVITALKKLPAYISYSWNTGQLKTTLKFLSVGTFGLILNIAIVKTLISLGMDAKPAGIISTILTIFTNFLINDVWTFTEHRDKRPWLHRLGGYYAASAGSMIVQITIYELLIMLSTTPELAVIVSVGISYFIRLVYIRDKVYKYTE